MSAPTAQFTLRQAVPTDAAGIARVHVRGWQVAYKGIMPAHFLAAMDVRERTSAWESTLYSTTLRHEVWVAVACDNVVGWVTYGPSRDADADPAMGEIHGLYVDPDWWGGGVGTALIDHAGHRLHATGMDVATLWVLEANTRSIAFYRARGFTPDGARGIYERDWTSQPQLRMARVWA